MRGSFSARRAVGLAALVAALSMAVVAVPAAQASKVEDFHGKVVSTQKNPKSVTVDTRSGGKVRFRVTQQTKFDHINGFSGLKPGLKVEVHAKQQSGSWVATKIDRQTRH